MFTGLQLPPGINEQALYWGLIGLGALFVLSIVVLFVRKFSGKSSASPLMDADFLENLQARGGLTQEEMRNIRDAMLRQAAARERTRTQGASLSDLKLMAATGIEPTPEPKRPTPEKPESPASPSAPPESPPSGKPPMPPEQLLENGLISQEDYEVLKARRKQEGR